MTKKLDFYNDIIDNHVCLPIPRGSFITVFNPVFLDSDDKRNVHAKTMVSNKNLFMYVTDMDRIGYYFNSDTNNQNEKFTIFLVYPGESDVKNARFLCKSNEKIDLVFLSIKALNEFPIKIHNPKFLFIFMGFFNWASVVLSMVYYNELTITGGDISRRHLISPLSIRLLDILTVIFNRNLKDLDKLGFRYDLPKMFVNPVISNEFIKKIITPFRNCTPPENVANFLKDKFCTNTYSLPQEKRNKYNYSINWTEYEWNIDKGVDINTLKTIQENKLKRYKNSGVFNSTQKRNVHVLIQKRNVHNLINPEFKPSFNVYDNLKYFLINNKSINCDTQIEIEKYLIQHATSEVQTNKDISGIHINIFSAKTTEFLLEYRPILLEKIKKLLKNKDSYSPDLKSTESLHYLAIIIDKIKSNFVLKLLLGRYIKILSFDKFHLNPEKNLSNTIMSDIGNDLTREYFYKLYKETLKNKLEKNIIKKSYDYSYSDWKKENLSLFNFFNQITLKIGMAAILIEWLEDSGLITRNFIKIEKKLYGIINPPSALTEKWKNLIPQEILTSNKNFSNKSIIELTAPIRLPCIIPPKLYTKTENGKYRLGGYWLNDEMFADDLILENYDLNEQSVIKPDNKIYDLVNCVNSVSYKINLEVLKFIKENPLFYSPDLLVNVEHPLSKLIKLSKTQKKEIQRYYSKLELQQHILNIADLFSNIPEFYFVNRIDFRGRLNCVTEYLNYQSTELAKALLLFSKPSIVNRNNRTSVNYLKMFGANCFGNKIDKLSADKKIDWVDNNITQILDFRNGELISKANNKFLFTAFCIEFKRWWCFYYESTENYFNTYLPVQLDASCNGFQHLVLLSGESKLRGELNLNSTDFSKTPGDFYSYVLGLLQDYFNNSLKNDCLKIDEHEKKACYIRLSKFCSERSIVKKMIMTLPYNATNYKIVDDLREILIESKEKLNDDDVKIWLAHDKNKNAKVSMNDLYILIDIVRKIIDTEAPKITKLKYYLTKVAECCTKLQLHIPWVLPTGLEVRQSYIESTKVQIKPFTYSDSSISLKMRTKNLDGSKQTRAFMPNLIHSLDSSSLTILLNKYFNNTLLDVKNIYTIHDCFAMPMNHVEFIIDSLRKVYVSIYSEPSYLKRLNKGILDHIYIHYGEYEYIEEKNIIIVKINGIPTEIEFPNIKSVLGETLTPPILEDNLKYILI